MRTHKGMTLVEILVAFFLLAIITVMFGQVVMRELRLMQDSRRLTVSMLNAAKEAEQTMQYYRNYIYSVGTVPPDMPLEPLVPLPVLFDREIICYPVDVEVEGSGGAWIHCAVANDKP